MYRTNNITEATPRNCSHLCVPDAVAEAEVPGDGDAGRLFVEPLLRDGGPVGEVAERRAAPVEEQDQAGGRKGGNAPRSFPSPGPKGVQR